MRIQVTEEDIANGKPLNPDCCPVALAVKKELKANDVKVNTSNRFIEVNNKDIYQMTDRLYWDIQYYDCFAEMAPFEFELIPI